ncbi:hypothetical protein CLOP_g2194 [Closterium sp. NIES-67]|nr:hypothetical protein CLOP_g2194 [Closterium sp. NIES-67]
MTTCKTCLLSKFTRFPFHGVAGKSKAALELVHMDLVGPFPVRGSKGESDKEIDGVQQKLTEQFKCKSLGEARYYLGMHIERDTERGWLKLHQG